WRPGARAAGLDPILIEAVAPFEERMATLLDTLRVRQFVNPGPHQSIGEDYAGVEDSLFLLEDTGHYNAAGHRLLAETVYAGLVEQGALEGLGQ
ncbi:MAG: hypothetical protein AAFZ65_19170, partial [Planctomycetota bacterium]